MKAYVERQLTVSSEFFFAFASENYFVFTSETGVGHEISYTNIVISDTFGEDSSLRCGWSFINLRRQFESLRRTATNCLLRNFFATLLHDTRVLLLKDMHKHGVRGACHKVRETF